MQDSACDSDIDSFHRKLKILYERWEFFSHISIFSNFGMFFDHFRIQLRNIIFLNFQILVFKFFKIKNNVFIKNTDLRACPAVTRLTVHRRLQSVPWQSNGSDFSKSVHYYCVTWIFLKVSHEFEASSLILGLWEAVGSDIDRRQPLKKWNFDFLYICWNFEKF